MVPSSRVDIDAAMTKVLEKVKIDDDKIAWIAVTGGQSRSIQGDSRSFPILKIPEVNAIARGGLALTGEQSALVVSAGSGTAMIAARVGQSTHVTGSAVGGGTLQGLARLLLDTTDPLLIDEMAR